MDIAREEREGVTVVRLGGDFDFHDVAQATDALGSLAEGAHRVVFDLKALGFISSGGIGFLIQTAKRLRTHGGEAVLAAPPANFGWVTETLGIDRIFRIFEHADAGLAYFREAAPAPRTPPS